MADNAKTAAQTQRLRAFRWFFWMSVFQVLLFFLVPAVGFPVDYVLHIEIISALTLGLVVAVYFGSVNLCGLLMDRNRRLLYVLNLIIVALWLVWAAVSWSYMDRMDYLLR